MSTEIAHGVGVQYDLASKAMRAEFGPSVTTKLYAQVRDILCSNRFSKEGASFYANRSDTAHDDLCCVMYELRQLDWLPRHLVRFGAYRIEAIHDRSAFPCPSTS